MLKPYVGMTYYISSLDKDLRIVVFPALSKPRTHILKFFSTVFFVEENKELNKPVPDEKPNIFINKIMWLLFSAFPN